MSARLNEPKSLLERHSGEKKAFGLEISPLTSATGLLMVLARDGNCSLKRVTGTALI